MRRNDRPADAGVFNASFHFEMASDAARVRAFAAALDDLVRPDDVVYDLGTGSGLLAILAARAGARKVYAIEKDPATAAVAARNFRLERLDALGDPIVADVTAFEYPEPADVVVCELLQTWLLGELQVQALDNAQRYLRPGARVVPDGVANEAVVVEADLRGPGVDLSPMPYVPLDPYRPSPRQVLGLTPALRTGVVTFDRRHDPQVRGRCAGTALRGGVANAVRLDSVATLGRGRKVGRTPTLFNSYLVPLREPAAVSDGDVVELSYAYRFGGGWDELELSVTTRAG